MSDSEVGEEALVPRWLVRTPECWLTAGTEAAEGAPQSTLPCVSPVPAPFPSPLPRRCARPAGRPGPARTGPTWRVLVLVLLEVPVQVGLLPEAPVAQVALEGLLLVVDVADVPLEVGGDAEGAVAVLAPGRHAPQRSARPRPGAPPQCSPAPGLAGPVSAQRPEAPGHLTWKVVTARLC